MDEGSALRLPPKTKTKAASDAGNQILALRNSRSDAMESSGKTTSGIAEKITAMGPISVLAPRSPAASWRDKNLAVPTATIKATEVLRAPSDNNRRRVDAFCRHQLPNPRNCGTARRATTMN